MKHCGELKHRPFQYSEYNTHSSKETFYESCSEISRKIYRKTPAVKSFHSKIAGPQYTTLLK